ncbi:hypothetical protein [Xenorhabdus koppenhoeferi]|nr:hypothetical protein [Xenorhabdus sp. Vera]
MDISIRYTDVNNVEDYLYFTGEWDSDLIDNQKQEIEDAIGNIV